MAAGGRGPSGVPVQEAWGWGHGRALGVPAPSCVLSRGDGAYLGSEAGRRSRVRAQLGHGSAGSTAPSQPHCTPASARPARAEASVRAWRQRSSRQGRCVQYLPSKVAALLSLPILMA